MLPSSIAVLGGGITGLSATFHLSRKFPTSRILLVEKSNRLGGWVKSKHVKFPIPGGDVGNVVIECGPRTLRPNSRAVLELINLLNLQSQLISTPTSSPAARKRFLYIADNDRPGLTPIPSSALGFLTSKLALTVIPSALREPFRAYNRPPNAEDDSLDGLMSRRFGPEFARLLGSALVHGIYAADSSKLSVKTAMKLVWDAETNGKGSVVRGFYKGRGRERQTEGPEAYDMGEVEARMHGVSVFSFRGGLQTITDALEENLKNSGNVEVITGSDVRNISPESDSIKITTDFSSFNVSHLVSALPLPTLNSILSHSHSPSKLPHLLANPYSTVIVVTFIFAAPPHRVHPEGFGYLIPRPKEGYSSPMNSEGILGVVFDSCSVGAQDRPHGQLTKMTMMIGGPYMPYLDHLPITDTPRLTKILFDRLQKQLGRRLPTPSYVEVTRQEDCIPTPTIGHLERMDELKDALGGKPWNGRVEVVGAGVGGVSVGDCVAQGRAVGQMW
ncbi:hypothetical protein BU17DRAFT_54043 [Hysterangium stoloniferum]|nr:hypothetical protein BU17DRAFT_54043 [Hysterangium stoloniferum]